MGNQTMEKVIATLKESGMYCGIGHRYNNLIHLRKAYTQAIMALKLGSKYYPKQHLFFYKDCTMLEAIDVMVNYYDDIITEFCHPSLLYLKSYDETHNTDYFNTLFAHVRNLNNQQSAALELGIHRNSLSYRLDKVETLSFQVPFVRPSSILNSYTLSKERCSGLVSNRGSSIRSSGSSLKKVVFILLGYIIFSHNIRCFLAELPLKCRGDLMYKFFSSNYQSSILSPSLSHELQ